jgi:hypothetical protein
MKNNPNELEGSLATEEEEESPVLRWKITNYDPETTESPDDIESELQRLKALKSYHLLDIEGHASIHLVDLERVWCLAGTGPLTPPHELPRRESVCAHVILAKPAYSSTSAAEATTGSTPVYTPLVVSDLSQDTRFQHFPTILGAPFWRFYAGMPLINADGMKLGSLSVFDTKPRNCWDPDQSEMLTQLAGIVVSLMEEHRAALPSHQKEDPLPKNKNDSNNTEVSKDKDTNKDETNEPEMKKRKINSSEDVHQEHVNGDKGETAAVDGENWVAAIRKDNRDTKSNQPGRAAVEVGIVTTVQIRTFVNILEEVMGEFPKKADLVFAVDPSLPEEVVFNDLKVFRSAIALLTSACERTMVGQVTFSVFARPSQESQTNYQNDLVVECKDTAPNIPVEYHPYLFEETNNISNDDESTNNNDHDSGSMQFSIKASEVGVRGVASYISTIDGGRYGFAPRAHTEESENNAAATILPHTGSIFWFSVPLIVMQNAATST